MNQISQCLAAALVFDQESTAARNSVHLIVDNQIRDDATASDLALLIVAVIEGGIMLSRLRKDEKPMRTCLALLRRLLRSGESNLAEKDNKG